MATLLDKNLRKRVKVSQVPTVPSEEMPSPNVSIQKKMINSLPNEMLQHVFGKLEMNKLIGIRGVCTRWQGLAEDICREKRSIVIESKAKNNPNLFRSFNGLIDFSKDWTILKVKPTVRRRTTIVLSSNLCILLGKLFPKVENFALNVNLQRTAGTADNLFTILKNWSSTLVTLGLGTSNSPIDKSRYDELFDHINNLTKRFAFAEHFEAKYKLDFLTRLEHCSFGIWKTSPLLGENCTSLRLLNFLALDQIQFLKLNAPLVKGLTRLGLVQLVPEVLSFICANFGVLQMLDIGTWFGDFNADTISKLAQLSKLTQLSIQDVKLDLPTLARSNLSTLSSVHILAITKCKLLNGDQPFDGDQFCRVLSFVFPNLQQLTIKHRLKRVRDGIAQHLDHFAHLRKHVIAPLYPL